MATTRRSADLGAEVARRILVAVGRELRDARLDRGLSTRSVGRAAGMSATSVSRLERGLVANASVLDVARLHAAVGLVVSLRSFPDGQPIRDRAHLALLHAFRARLHPSIRWRSEVPVRPGDPRAWDAVIYLPGSSRYGIEAETSPRDVQALLRRLHLKREDGDVDGILLVLPITTQVRAFMREGGELLRAEFPADGARALLLLSGGHDPGGDAIIAVPGSFIRASRSVRPGAGGASGGVSTGVASHAAPKSWVPRGTISER